MSWNYRVTVETLSGVRVYSIREVYYLKDGMMGWTRDSMKPFGESPGELTRDIQRMLEATMQPIIDLDEEEAKND